MPHALNATHQAFEYNSIAPAGFFVLRHSLGAYVAPQSMASDPRIADCIIMAGPATPPSWSAPRQYRYLASLDLDNFVNINEIPQIKDFQRQCELSATPNLSLSTPPSEIPFGMGAAYWRDSANFTPIETCAREQRPVFVLQGARDYQVTLEDGFEKWRIGWGKVEMQGWKSTTISTTSLLVVKVNRHHENTTSSATSMEVL